jgi:hypothetical protein
MTDTSGEALREIENLLELIEHDTAMFDILLKRELSQEDRSEQVLVAYAEQIVKRRYIHNRLDSMKPHVKKLSCVRIVDASILKQS